MSGSTTYRLNCSRQTVEASKFSSYLKQERLTFKEVDFSDCSLTNDTLKVVLDICKRCPNLRILKLFKNQLDDDASQRLAEMLLKTPELEELHLSHNQFTKEGARCLVAAGETFGHEDKSQPLWLRLEQNSVEDPEKVIKELEEEFSVCRRADSVRCTVRTCVNKKKVHLPFFHLQRPPLRFKSRAELAAEAKAKTAPPVPTRSLSRPEAGAAAPKVVKPCAWGKGTTVVPNSSPTPTVIESGYSPQAKLEVEEKPQPEVLKPVWKAGSRPSVVLDSFGQRRTMPEQLDGVDPTPFVCSLCHFVMIKPLITRCSHIFCSCCFRQWVQTEVDRHKSENKTAGTQPVAVPQIRCPQPGCDQFLKKTDVEPADDGKTSGVQLFQRLRNNLNIRCVHHIDHHKLEFGQDASRILLEKGISCSWSGAPTAYEEHMSRNCAVENYLMSESCVDSTINSNEGTRSQYEAEPEPEDSVAHSVAPVAEAVAPPVAEAKVQDTVTSVTVNRTDGEVRIARYDYTPEKGDEAQIKISANDKIRVFQVTESGWAAGVRLCPKTMKEEGDAGWFPAGYLEPLQGAE